MKNENELLVNYIDDILYHPEQAKMDLSLLNEEYRSLGERIQRLGSWAVEADRFAGAVAKGDLDDGIRPNGENVFTRNIFEIQTILRRMTDQLEQIISQDCGPEPSEPQADPQRFDAMVRELRKRTSALENERNLFVQFTESASERIVVLDEETGDMLFANRVAREFREKTITYIDGADTLNEKSGCTFQNPYSEWMHTVVHPRKDGTSQVEYYQVHSIYIIWENRGAIAHMFSNVTELQAIQELAMKDSLTGVFNRTYAMRYLDRLYLQGRHFSVAFVDVDYLKYCNDTFGHSAGDQYLLQVTALLQQAGDGAVVCRTGGDEFMVISEQQTEVELRAQLDQLRRQLGLEYFDGSRRIHKSFSFGIAARTAETTADVAQILSRADERMYQDKLQNKKQNHLAFQDDRTP